MTSEERVALTTIATTLEEHAAQLPTVSRWRGWMLRTAERLRLVAGFGAGRFELVGRGGER